MSRPLGLIVLVSVLETVCATAQQTAVSYGNLVAAAGEQIANQCVRLLDEPPRTSSLSARPR